MSDHVSGHLFKREGKRGAVWYARYRVDGSEKQERIGKAWTEKGRPPEGYFTRKTAKAKLDEILTQARRGELPWQRDAAATLRHGPTFAEAAAEFLDDLLNKKHRDPMTVHDYETVVRLYLGPDFGEQRVAQITQQQIETY